MKRTADSALAWATIDFLSALLLVIYVLVAPPPKPNDALRTEGEYAVVLTWPKKCDADLDTYIRAPSGEIVYFNHMNGATVHLEHDDLGRSAAYAGQNFERAVLRGIQPGEYVANVHVYSLNECPHPRALVELWRLRGRDRRVTLRRLVFGRWGEERTAFRFSLRMNGTTFGVNHLPRLLVGAR